MSNESLRMKRWKDSPQLKPFETPFVLLLAPMQMAVLLYVAAYFFKFDLPGCFELGWSIGLIDTIYDLSRNGDKCRFPTARPVFSISHRFAFDVIYRRTLGHNLWISFGWGVFSAVLSGNLLFWISAAFDYSLLKYFDFTFLFGGLIGGGIAALKFVVLSGKKSSLLPRDET